jgi:DNA-binding LacI/PurR family transcriptional regulator
MSPGLSFVDLSSKDMGKTAAKLLLGQIEGADKHRTKTTRLKERLSLRESTDIPKQN